MNEPPANEPSWVPAELAKREPPPAEAWRAPEEGSSAPPEAEISEWLPEGAESERPGLLRRLRRRSPPEHDSPVADAPTVGTDPPGPAEAADPGLQARVGEAEARAALLEAQLSGNEAERDELLERLATAETARRRAEEELERLQRVLEEAATTGGKRDARGRTELNSVTVEGLRALGLSITQAARLVARREATGGFRSTEDIAAVPGIPAAQRQALVERVYVDPTLASATPR